MQLTGEQVVKFQAIYKAKFGREISREHAYEQAIKLVQLMKIIYKPITQEDFKKVKKRQQELNNY